MTDVDVRDIAALRQQGDLGEYLRQARADKAEAIRAAAHAISDYALTHLGRDLGTIHIEPMAAAALNAAQGELLQDDTGIPEDEAYNHGVLDFGNLEDYCSIERREPE